LLLSAVITTVDLALFKNVGNWLMAAANPHHDRFEPAHCPCHQHRRHSQKSRVDCRLVRAARRDALRSSSFKRGWAGSVTRRPRRFVSTYRIATNREVSLRRAWRSSRLSLPLLSTARSSNLFAGQKRTFRFRALCRLNVFLIPLLVLAALQYALSTIATAWFISFEAGKFTLVPTPETVVWTLTTKLAGAASAVRCSTQQF
jgi:hypothetical protein